MSEKPRPEPDPIREDPPPTTRARVITQSAARALLEACREAEEILAAVGGALESGQRLDGQSMCDQRRKRYRTLAQDCADQCAAAVAAAEREAGDEGPTPTSPSRRPG